MDWDKDMHSAIEKSRILPQLNDQRHLNLKKGLVIFARAERYD